MHIVSELLGHLLLRLSFWLYLLSFHEWFPYLIFACQSRRSRIQFFLVINFSSHHATAEDSADGRTDERTNNDTHEE
ncbi:hypothetical protein QR685DRAFT_335508 [Neurospora intermedia]|uniref:Secreted protein n=1 Tax=Neurospora intermedia TaxID=5142 RepID=A0ABR3D8R4_NEUIN